MNFEKFVLIVLVFALVSALVGAAPITPQGIGAPTLASPTTPLNQECASVDVCYVKITNEFAKQVNSLATRLG